MSEQVSYELIFQDPNSPYEELGGKMERRKTFPPDEGSPSHHSRNDGTYFHRQ
jgi:hypothetical protein